MDLPCLSIQTEFTAAAITWQFNGLNIHSSVSYARLNTLSFLIFFNFFFLILYLAGKNISAGVSGFARVKDGGLHLSIPLVTVAHEGEYTCLVKGDTTEILRIYRVRVDGKQNYKKSHHEF